MNKRYEIWNQKYEIWIGNYHLGQGSTPPSEPQLIDVIWANCFENACYIHECKTKYEWALKLNERGYIDDQSKEWFYDYKKNRNSWTGQYFESKEEAQKTFK